MNRNQMIHRAIELGEKINDEPNMTLEKVDWIIEKGKIECLIGIHNL